MRFGYRPWHQQRTERIGVHDLRCEQEYEYQNQFFM